MPGPLGRAEDPRLRVPASMLSPRSSARAPPRRWRSGCGAGREPEPGPCERWSGPPAAPGTPRCRFRVLARLLARPDRGLPHRVSYLHAVGQRLGGDGRPDDATGTEEPVGASIDTAVPVPKTLTMLGGADSAPHGPTRTSELSPFPPARFRRHPPSRGRPDRPFPCRHRPGRHHSWSRAGRGWLAQHPEFRTSAMVPAPRRSASLARRTLRRSPSRQRPANSSRNDTDDATSGSSAMAAATPRAFSA